MEELVEDLVNVAQSQTALAGLPSVVSGDTARPQTSLMETQMLANVPPLQTVLNGPRPAPSGDIARRRAEGDQTADLPRLAGRRSQLMVELEGRLEEEREGKCQLTNGNLLHQTPNRNRKEMGKAEAVEREEEEVEEQVGL